MMNDDPKDRPSCYGVLETVFPLRSDGLRVTPISCLQCVHKTGCLRSAMGGTGGFSVREEMIDRAYRGGLMGFFQRWSNKKNIQRMKKKSGD